MSTPSLGRMSASALALSILLLLLIAVPVLAGITLWTVERYMDITPADWPYPGSFWDRANDFTCGLILLPSGAVGRFAFWLVFFPVPIAIEFYRRNPRKAVLFMLCILLPLSYSDILFENPLSNGPLYPLLILVVLIGAPPFLIRSWSALCKNAWEKRLIRLNLMLLWWIYIGADVMLGLEVHHDYCKPALGALSG